MNIAIHFRRALSRWKMKSELSCMNLQQFTLAPLLGSLMNFSSTSRSLRVSRLVQLNDDTFKNWSFLDSFYF